MRLILDALLRPDSVERLRALSSALDVVEVAGDESFEVEKLRDPEVEIIVGARVPGDLTRVPNLRWLQARSAGVDHLAADPPWDKGIIVTNARGVFAIPIGEYVTGAILRINQPTGAWAADQAARHWPSDNDGKLATIARGKTAVVVGYGSIGREVARQLSALGLRILAVKPRPELRSDESFRVPGTGDPDGSIPAAIVGEDALVTVAEEADYLVLTLPLTPASRGLIGRTVLAALPSHAWLINVSRGPLVDESSLIEALRTGRLAGAILDVAGQEPLGPESPLWDTPNVTITPHVSGATLEYLDDLVVENVRRYLAGEPLLNRVDPGRGY